MDSPERKITAGNKIGSSAHGSINSSWHSLGLEDIFQSPRGRKKHSARKNISNHSSRFNAYLRASHDASFPHEIAVYQRQEAACDPMGDQPSDLNNIFQSTMTTVDDAVGDDDDALENADNHQHLDSQDTNNRHGAKPEKLKQVHDHRTQLEETTIVTEDLTCSTDFEQSYTDIFNSSATYAIKHFASLPSEPSAEELIEIISVTTDEASDGERFDDETRREREPEPKMAGHGRSCRKQDSQQHPQLGQSATTRQLSPRHERLINKLDKYIGQDDIIRRHTRGRSVSGRSRRSTASSVRSNASSKTMGSGRSHCSRSRSIRRGNEQSSSQTDGYQDKVRIAISFLWNQDRTKTESQGGQESLHQSVQRSSKQKSRPCDSRESDDAVRRKIRIRSDRHSRTPEARSTKEDPSREREHRRSHGTGVNDRAPIAQKTSSGTNITPHRDTAEGLSRHRRHLRSASTSSRSNARTTHIRSSSIPERKSDRHYRSLGRRSSSQSHFSEVDPTNTDVVSYSQASHSRHERSKLRGCDDVRVNDVLQNAGITDHQVALLRRMGLKIAPGKKESERNKPKR